MLKNVWTDGPMNGPTDRPRCRVACTRLKMNRKGKKKVRKRKLKVKVKLKNKSKKKMT